MPMQAVIRLDDELRRANLHATYRGTKRLGSPRVVCRRIQSRFSIRLGHAFGVSRRTWTSQGIRWKTYWQ